MVSFRNVIPMPAVSMRGQEQTIPGAPGTLYFASRPHEGSGERPRRARHH